MLGPSVCSHAAPPTIEACFDRVRDQLRRKAPTCFPELPRRDHVARLFRRFERGELSSGHEDYAFLVFLARVWHSRGNEGSDRVILPEFEALGLAVWLRDGWLELRRGTEGESRELREERMGPTLARIFELTAGPVHTFS